MGPSAQGVRLQDSALRVLGSAVSVWVRARVLPSLPLLCLVAAVGSEASRVVCVCLFVLKKSWNPRGSAVLSLIWNSKRAALLQPREFPCPEWALQDAEQGGVGRSLRLLDFRFLCRFACLWLCGFFS